MSTTATAAAASGNEKLPELVIDKHVAYIQALGKVCCGSAWLIV